MKMNKRFIVITSKDEIGVKKNHNFWVVKETVGVGIINPRGIKKFTIVGDE